MLLDHFRSNVPERINKISLDDSVNDDMKYDMITRQVINSLSHYLENVLDTINRLVSVEKSKADMSSVTSHLNAVVSQLTPDGIKDCVLALMVDRGFEAVGVITEFKSSANSDDKARLYNAADLYESSKLDEIATEVSGAFTICLNNALTNINAEVNEDTFSVIKSFFPQIANIGKVASHLKFQKATPQYLVDNDAINPILLNKALNPISEDDYVVMMGIGCQFSHNKHDYLCYGDIPESVRNNPILVCLNQANRELHATGGMNRSELDDCDFLEDGFRHEKQTQLEKIIETFASPLINFNNSAISTYKGHRLRDVFMSALTETLKERTISDRVSKEFSEKLNSLCNANSLVDLHHAALDAMYAGKNSDQIFEYALFIHGDKAMHGIPANTNQWLELCEKPKELSEALSNLITTIAEHAAFLNSVCDSLNRICEKMVSSGDIDNQSLKELCIFFRSTAYPGLANAIEVNDNTHIANLVVALKNKNIGSIDGFLNLFNSAQGWALAKAISLNESVSRQEVRAMLETLCELNSPLCEPIVDIRTINVADALAGMEKKYAGAMKDIDMELELIKNHASENKGMQRFFKNLVSDVQSNSIEIEEKQADVSFLSPGPSL